MSKCDRPGCDNRVKRIGGRYCGRLCSRLMAAEIANRRLQERYPGHTVRVVSDEAARNSGRNRRPNPGPNPSAPAAA